MDTRTVDCTRCTLMDSGLYTVHVNGEDISVYCDMTTEAGGWLVSDHFSNVFCSSVCDRNRNDLIHCNNDNACEYIIITNVKIT